MAAAEVKSVQLVSEEQTGIKFLHNFAIEDKWEDLQVAVIGIMGDKNSGKSFLMNVIAEYLRFEESGTGGWTNNFKKGKTTVSGFEIKEIEGITEFNDGLHIWPRPFLIKRSGESKEIAVILLDLNMKEVTPSMQLIMSLLCSTIIYNTNSNDVYKFCLLIKAIKQSRLEVRCEEITSSLKDLLFEQIIMVFRDQQIKCGQDKSLKHLQSVVKGNQFLEACDDKSNLDSYLLPTPKQCFVNAQGYLEMDKAFSQYITPMITKAFSIDDLHLKSWNGSPITVKKLFSILEFICNFDLPLLQEFNLSAESSIEESMETNSEDTNPFLDNDVEMEDLQNLENKSSSDKSTTLRLTPNQHLTKEKLNEEKYLHANGKTEETKKEVTAKQERNEAGSTHFNDNGEVEGTRQNIFVTNEEIYNKIEKIEKAVGIKAKRFYESRKCTPEQIENEFRRIYEKAKEEFEEFCSTNTIKNPVRILSTFDNRILGILEESAKKANERDDGKKEKFLEFNKPKDISHVIESQLQLYNESMTELLTANMSISKKTLSEKHRSLMEKITNTIMCVCNEENILVNDVLPLVLPQLENAYKSYQTRVGPVDDLNPRAETIEPFLDKMFIRECKQRLESGAFFETEATEIINSGINISIQEIRHKCSTFSQGQIERTMKNLSTVKKYSQIIEYLKKTLKLYILEINKKQQMYNFLSTEQIIKFHSDAIKKLLSTVDNAENQEILDVGFQVVEKQYQALNANIIHNEQETFTSFIIPEIKILYDKEMKYFVEKKKPTAAQMTEEHEKLKKQCTSVIVKACSYKDPNIPLLQNCFDEMNKELDKQLQIAIKSNKSIAEDLQNKIQGAVKKAHSEYTNAMRKNINGKTYSASELQNLHTSCLRQAAAVMKLDIRAIDYNEDPQMYLNKLQMRTENEFKTFGEQNNKAIQQNNKSSKPHTRQDTNEEKARRHQEWKSEPFTNFTDATHNDTKTQEKCVPIIAIEFGLHTIKTGVIINGMLNFVPNEFGESEFPNVVAITKQGEVLVGSEVSYRSADISYQFHPGKLMKLLPDEVTAACSEKVQFQGQDTLATKEFLCGLILSRIKKYSELFLKQYISAAVITVPLWYTSSQRQATKDAGVIAGFQSVNLINDITAGALAYAKQPYNRYRYHDVLMINAIGGNVDVAVYDMSGGKIKMKSCAGFLHGQTYLQQPGVLKALWEKCKTFWHGNTSASGDETETVKKLVEYCVKNNYYVTVSTVLFDKDTESNHHYLDHLKFIASRKDRQYFHIENAILFGAAIFADLLNNCSEYTAKSSKSDLLPYQIEFVRPIPSTHGKIFEEHAALSSTELKQDITIQSKGEACISILEIGNAGNIKTGFLHIPVKESGIVYSEVIAFISSEGILRFTPRQRYGAAKIDVLWNSYNLGEEEIAKYASLISSYYPNPEQLKILQSCKADLRKLAQALLSNSKQSVSGLGKQRISDMVQEAFKAVDAEYTTLERIEQITNDLVKLKSTYCSNM